MVLTLETSNKDVNWGCNKEENGNLVTANSETNTHDYLSTTRGNYQQNSSSAVANQPFIWGYSSATPDNNRQSSSSAIAN